MKSIICTDDCDVYMIEDYLDRERYQNIRGEVKDLPFVHHQIRVYDRWFYQPRYTCLLHEDGKTYRYSGVEHPSIHMGNAPEIRKMMEEVNNHLNTNFNSCLLNHYWDGTSGIGAHSDDEEQLSGNKVVASFSMGGKRKMNIRNKFTKERTEVYLMDNSLFVMKGETQRKYTHEIPKTKRHCEPRTSITFREIH